MIKIKERERWVDIAKGIAIMAVVFGHMEFVDSQLKLFPSSMLAVLWHVAVFFLIGGFYLRENNLINPTVFIRGKFSSLYLLILYVFIPVLLFHNILINIGFYDLTTYYSGRFVTYWNVRDLIENIVLSVFFAGREPLLGAMWFVYVLFIALCLLSFISYITHKIVSQKNYEKFRFALILTLAIISSTLTNVFDITIPRCNNVFTAILLIYVGMMIKQRYKVKFDSGYVASICVLVVWHIASTKGTVSIVANIMPNVTSLLVSSVSSLYIICYLSKVLDKWPKVGGALSQIGKESFYIMGFHFIGFKFCTLFFNLLGMNLSLSQLKAPIGDKYWLIPFYLAISITFSLLLVKTIRFCKSKIVKSISQSHMF